MQRYNIALLLTDQAIESKITRISREYFLGAQDKYILGADGLPHITLCQFKAKSLDDAVAVYADFSDKNKECFPFSASIEKFHVRPGKFINAGTFIAEYKAHPSPELVSLQGRCVETLASYGVDTLTPSEGYSPHITLARLSKEVKRVPSQGDLNCPLEIEFSLAIGLSTEEGVFVKDLCSSAPLF